MSDVRCQMSEVRTKKLTSEPLTSDIHLTSDTSDI
jgi:hypothetical protein